LDAGHTGLRPAAPVAPPAGSPAAADAVGGAVLISQPVPADEPFAVVVQLKPGRPADDLIVQVFVSAAEDFSPDKATSSNELVWLLQGSRQKVVAGDRMEVDAPRPDAAGKPDGKGDPLVVRLVVGKQLAVVSTGAQRLWAGPSGLAAKPRTVGVRYIRLDGTKPAGDPPVVQSIRVLKR
ncbi:MAG: hypothetical protein JWO31_3094, partial [Phycisphaerales bacterium]|nr:hypothetical protein [Phycisphaerales bacterium]